MIEVDQRGSLADGTTLVARYRGQQHVATVKVTDGKTTYLLVDGRAYKTPSAAGKAITGRASCDGWKFWGVYSE